MDRLPLEVYRSLHKLGLLDAVLAQRRQACMTFACGCQCKECLTRENPPKKPQPKRFPWEMAA